MKRLFVMLAMCCGMTVAFAPSYWVPVPEQNEKMQMDKYEPKWESLEMHQTPEHLNGTIVRTYFMHVRSIATIHYCIGNISDMHEVSPYK